VLLVNVSVVGAGVVLVMLLSVATCRERSSLGPTASFEAMTAAAAFA
jgi:hypothetical protein